MNDRYKKAVFGLIGAHGAPYDVFTTAICRVRRAHQASVVVSFGPYFLNAIALITGLGFLDIVPYLKYGVVSTFLMFDVTLNGERGWLNTTLIKSFPMTHKGGFS